MSAAEKKGKLIEKIKIGEDQILLRFEPVGPIYFQPGQFLSLKVPVENGFVWRPYSFANSMEKIKENGCELFIKYQPGGAAKNYLEQLNPGAVFEFKAPYGDFTFKKGRGRPVVFISTGTGLAPIRSMAFSADFLNEARAFSVAILGFQKASHIPFVNEFEKCGIDYRYALSRECPSGNPHFFPGRVILFLQQIPNDFDWADCDYYLCGNKYMIQEVTNFLSTKQVPIGQVFFEAFESSQGTIIQKKTA